MDYQSWSSLTAMFFAQAHKGGDKPFLWAKQQGSYRPLSWKQTAVRVTELSRGLRALGLEPGGRVVLVSENRPEWLISDLAIMAAGAVTVPAYTTNTAEDHNHILTNSEATGAIVSSRALARQLLPAAIEAPDCQWVVSIEDLDIEQQPTVEIHHWDGILSRGRMMPDDVEEVVAKATRDDVACFIYTSGTGGAPKGVMLSHANILCNCMGAHSLLETIGLGDDVFLSFLPLSHAYEHSAGQFFPIGAGAQIYYAESVDKLLNNLAECRPTIMTAVPRLYESMHQRILRGVVKQGGAKQKLFEQAVRLGTKAYRDPRSLSLGERLMNLLVERLVREKVRGRFGGRLKAMVSGGAALNTDIGEFFIALGLPILQGYGQTEAAPVITANPPGRVKMHTVGPPLKGVEVRIAEDGEILVRGELVMKGYWRGEDWTAKVLRDGWLHTGDIGQLDEDGYLQITDRKKDIIVFSGGDNVSPARIEGFLTLEPEISQAMVYGDKRPYLVGVVVPDDEFLAEWAAAAGKPAELAQLQGDPELRKALAAAIDRVNGKLAKVERLRRFTVARGTFTTENEMMTPTLKIRRHKILELYKDALEGLYEKK